MVTISIPQLFGDFGQGGKARKARGHTVKSISDVQVRRPEMSRLMPTYIGRVLPALRVRESERKRNVALAAILTVLSFAAMWWVFYGPMYIMSGADGFEALAAPIGLVVFAIVPGAWILRRLSKSIKTDFAVPLVESLGWYFKVDAPEPYYFRGYCHYKMLPRFDRKSFEDLIVGRHQGADFEMTEIHLETRHKNNYHTVFRGFVLSVDFHQPFDSKTIVLRDRKLLNRKTLDGLKRVGMASLKWEKLFEAYSSDQVEARVKLDPAFMERLMELETSVDGKNIRFGFFDSRLHVVCETADRFEAGSMFKPLDDPERLQTFIDEIEALLSVIEGVQKSPTRSRVTAQMSAMETPIVPSPVAPMSTAAPAPQLPGHMQPNPYL